MKKKTAKRSVSKLKKDLDKIFSQFIRQRGASHDGTTSCYTCGLKRHWKELQCGHFVPRQYLATRYDEINCQPQCYACNMLYNGQPSAFAIRLKREFGDNIIDRLERDRRSIVKDFPYEAKIAEYKEKLSTGNVL